jgi:hypothetical protein
VVDAVSAVNQRMRLHRFGVLPKFSESHRRVALWSARVSDPPLSVMADEMKADALSG